MTVEQPARFFVSGTCDLCGEWFLRTQETLGEGVAGPSYCSDAHRRRAKKRRAKDRPPVPAAAPPPSQPDPELVQPVIYPPCPCCHRKIFRADAPVCGVCWSLAASMCLGKRRLTEEQADLVEERTGRLAKWCICCGWFHNTGHPIEDPGAFMERIQAVLGAMTEAKGRLWVSDLVDSWDPSVRDRRQWVEARARHVHPGDA